jgi:hypothetical protein
VTPQRTERRSLPTRPGGSIHRAFFFPSLMFNWRVRAVSADRRGTFVLPNSLAGIRSSSFGTTARPRNVEPRSRRSDGALHRTVTDDVGRLTSAWKSFQRKYVEREPESSACSPRDLPRGFARRYENGRETCVANPFVKTLKLKGCCSPLGTARHYLIFRTF